MPNLPKLANPFSGGPSILTNPFRQPAHPPPRQKNDTYGEASWWADWKWLVPFSSTLTLDEDRLLLPPLRERPPIYCYYDTTIKKEAEAKAAESELLLTWRRAWWAKGFKPVILGAAEAMNNPLYEKLQRIEMDQSLKIDVMRWLAWENMGGGLMAQYTLLPMGAYDDPLLVFLRRGDYPNLTTWTDINNGLFAGPKIAVTEAVKNVMSAPGEKLRESKDFLSAAPDGTFQPDSVPKALAYYDLNTVEKKYTKVGDLLASDRAAGLSALAKLINAHLHTTWQNVFQDGIAVLKPKPDHTTHLVSDAWELAQALSSCLDSPIQVSCPPNMPKCSPCDPSKETNVKLTTPEHYHNSSGLFTIGTVPHPYTLAMLDNVQESLTIRWIRREMRKRDPWVTSITTELLGTEVGSARRVMRFKEAVVGEFATSHCLWLTAEKEPPSDLPWRFGFQIPHFNHTSSGRPQPPFGASKHTPTQSELETEKGLLMKAVKIGGSKEPETVDVRMAMEAWNLADIEAWKFARAWLARSTVERMEWEKEESRYTHGAGSEEGERSWSRWHF